MECVSCGSHDYGKFGTEKSYFQVYCNRQTWGVDSLKRCRVAYHPMSAIKENYDIQKLVDELCVKLKEIEDNETALFDISTARGISCQPSDALVIYSNAMVNDNNLNANEAQPLPTFNSVWTRGLLHDSEPFKDQIKMDDYFSSLFYDNPSDNVGFDFSRFKSDERQDGNDRYRITAFYNRQNLIESHVNGCDGVGTERLYERNPDMDKLIAKFDANIEGIWKPPYDSNELGSLTCEANVSDNILTDSYFQTESSLVWSFSRTGSDQHGSIEKETIENYKPDFSAWSKFSSPIIPSTVGMNEMLNSVNLALSNVQKWSSSDGQTDGRQFLNHKNHESGFAQVLPNSGAFGGNREGFRLIVSRDRKKTNCGDEEDLLTSAKTHFRPIRTEETIGNGQAVAYADGTTFPISNEFEKVKFTRSNSGVLYLESESEFEAPKKYMEYREREAHPKLIDFGSDASLMDEFIPKFRVRQSNEKCCQTEDLDDGRDEKDQIVPSVMMNDGNTSDGDPDSYECDEFFFPGDSELAENIDNCIGKFELKHLKSDCNYNDIYIPEGMAGDSRCVCCSLESGGWPGSGMEVNARQERSDIWCPQNSYDVCKCGGLGIIGQPTGDEYFRFREELTQEGEQLLSDLSCLQQMYSRWGDDESGTGSELNDDSVFCSSEFLNVIRSAENLMQSGNDDDKKLVKGNDKIFNGKANDKSHKEKKRTEH